ncbi:GNAT family N-acetyltransferase [Prescottella agglutinans]|uniref:GNAT superfamily N-acetyltransferase n=1 Tax=Prescottella agglutinans TaxID=1644129 RepID=A0ABT6MCT5_9NOCA|nr:GNAT family N-acetyltransferase [Prescottella agglutinans]MDH6282055.1 GNAT superfamily N-acetyltransferase [Prescottella agglutinans]
MESVVIMNEADAGELLTLQRAAYVTEARAHDDVHLPPLTQSLVELAAELRDPNVIAVGLRGERSRLVAAVRLRIDPNVPHEAELGRLVVVPDLQGRGLGSRLLTLAEQRAPESVTTLRLFTGEHSAANLRLYTRFGYVESHRTTTPGGYDLVHLAKTVR